MGAEKALTIRPFKPIIVGFSTHSGSADSELPLIKPLPLVWLSVFLAPACVTMCRRTEDRTPET